MKLTLAQRHTDNPDIETKTVSFDQCLCGILPSTPTHLALVLVSSCVCLWLP